MRLLTRAQLRRRLLVFAGLAAAFTGAVWVTEVTITSYEGMTAWAVFAAFLGLVSLLSLVRWRGEAVGEPQEEWQPALMLRVLGGGLAFQAGVIGYFVANDVVAASIGCAAFFFVLGYGMAALQSLDFAEVP